MKVILNNFEYKGRHFDRYEVEIENLNLPDMSEPLDDETVERITECIVKSLDKHMQETES